VLLERKRLTSGHHLARRRSHRPAARLEHADQARQVLGGLMAELEAETGVATGLPPERLAVAGAFGRAPGGAEAPGHHGQGVGVEAHMLSPPRRAPSIR
jgi:hypothetical protein